MLEDEAGAKSERGQFFIIYSQQEKYEECKGEVGCSMVTSSCGFNGGKGIIVMARNPKVTDAL